MSGDIKVITTKEKSGIAVREKVKYADIGPAMGRMFGEVAGYMTRKGLPMTGAPFCYYYSWADGSVDMEVGFPSSAKNKEDGRFHSFALPAVKAAFMKHVGPYDKLMESYQKMEKQMKEQGLRPADHMWEIYMNDPEKTAPAELVTELYWPVA
jgi:effector-binding domain-containing protein